jgi:hypothetical protein
MGPFYLTDSVSFLNPAPTYGRHNAQTFPLDISEQLSIHIVIIITEKLTGRNLSPGLYRIQRLPNDYLGGASNAACKELIDSCLSMVSRRHREIQLRSSLLPLSCIDLENREGEERNRARYPPTLPSNIMLCCRHCER